jgi:hypothetical protein
MTISIKPTASGSTIEQDGSTVLSVESDRSVDIDSGTLHVDATNNRVGIGTSIPQQKLTVKVTTNQNFNVAGNAVLADGIRIASNNDDGSQAGMQFGASQFVWTDTGVEQMRIDSNGRLDVAQPLMYLGNSQAMRCSNSAYVQDATRASGYIQFGTTIGAVGVNYFTSDANKKENIQPSTYNSSSLVENIEFVEFDWKPDAGDEGHVQVGVTAQQLKTLDERLVAELEDGSLMVKEPALITHLAKALQEQIAKVKDLETRVATLEGN